MLLQSEEEDKESNRPIHDGLSQDDISSGNIIAIILALNGNCKTPFQECITTMTQQQKPGDEITCIIYDELMYFAEAAANHLKLSSMILCTTSVATALSRLAIPHLKEEGCIPWQESMSQDRVPDLHSLRFKDLPVSMFGVPDNFLDLIAQMYNARKSSAVIFNTIDCLEQSHDGRNGKASLEMSFIGVGCMSIPKPHKSNASG
ncbi:unnamed protein product [Dovyalis caffra]|uniref:Uncharacterized protein n=1 Tax=Dovyalis caffra TaxID=77055 RepID=A0AAV1RCI0_9ROSI|nr:unnamed protein product [Dovyalis caffra]